MTSLPLGSFLEREYGPAPGMPPTVADQQGSTDLPDKARDAKQDKKDEIAQEKAQEKAPAQLAPAINTALAMGFLDGLDPSGRHDLAAINPETERIECATFLPNEREKAARWVDVRQGKVNLYVSVNRARKDAPRDKRLSGNDIAAIRAITADIDIQTEDSSGQHFQRLKTKLLKEVVLELAKLKCRPALIVDSGGGVQLWWPLKGRGKVGRSITETEAFDGHWAALAIMRPVRHAYQFRCAVSQNRSASSKAPRRHHQTPYA
jgi:hypothetical protein